MNIAARNDAMGAAGRRGSRKPRIMVAGEFSAGKTRLINGLLGEPVLPSNVTSTSLPPVWLFGEGEALFRVDLEGNRHDFTSLDEIDVQDTHFCAISHPAPFLQRFDIIDTPGNSDPNIPAEHWERMLDFADAIVWCTNATQAWRQSEKAAWREMPEHLRRNSALLITHSDRMPGDDAAAKVMRRVRRDVNEDFVTIMMASLIDDDHLAAISEHLASLFLDLDHLPGSIHPEVERALSDKGQAAPGQERIAPRRILNSLLLWGEIPEPEAAGEDAPTDILILDNPLAADADEGVSATEAAEVESSERPAAPGTSGAEDPGARAEGAAATAPDEAVEGADVSSEATDAEAADLDAVEAVGDGAAEEAVAEDAPEAQDPAAPDEPEAEEPVGAEATALVEERADAGCPEAAPAASDPARSRPGPLSAKPPYPGLARDTWNLHSHGRDLTDVTVILDCVEATIREIDRSISAHMPRAAGEAQDDPLGSVASVLPALRGDAAAAQEKPA